MRHKIINAGMVFKIVITLIVCVGITVVIVLSRRNKDERDAVFLKEVTTAIQKGQDLNAPVEGEIKDYTLLHLAVLSNQYDAVKLLVEHGVDLNVRDSIGATPLHRGVQRGFFEISKLLIQSGAEIEAVNLVENNGKISCKGHYRIKRSSLYRYLESKKVKPMPDKVIRVSQSRQFPKVKNHLGL